MGQFPGIRNCLHGCFAKAVRSRVNPLIVVQDDTGVQVCLQFVRACNDFPFELYAIERDLPWTRGMVG